MDLARQNELSQLQSYVREIDKEVTMILQSVQWEQKCLLKDVNMVTCKYDYNHRIPSEKKEQHENMCFLKREGYNFSERLLPDNLDVNSPTYVYFNTGQIKNIIDAAAKSDPLFKKGTSCHNVEPLSLERLQSTYTMDERRAIHDAVVNTVPSCHALADSELPSMGNNACKGNNVKSRMEILAEMRDMRRRRTKYRVAAKTKNYSDVLRDVIKTQMELYNEAVDSASNQCGVSDSVNENSYVNHEKNDKHRYYTIKQEDPHKIEQGNKSDDSYYKHSNLQRKEDVELNISKERARFNREYKHNPQKSVKEQSKNVKEVIRSKEKSTCPRVTNNTKDRDDYRNKKYARYTKFRNSLEYEKRNERDERHKNETYRDQFNSSKKLTLTKRESDNDKHKIRDKFEKDRSETYRDRSSFSRDLNLPKREIDNKYKTNDKFEKHRSETYKDRSIFSRQLNWSNRENGNNKYKINDKFEKHRNETNRD